VRRSLVRGYGAVVRTVEFAVIGIMVALAVDVAAGVSSRYVVNAALSWTDELGGLLLVWMTFLGAVVALDRRTHLDMDPFGPRVSARVRIALRAAADLALAVFLIVILWNGSLIVTRLGSTMSVSLPVSRGLLQSVMPVSAALMLVVLAARWLLPEATAESRRHALASKTPALAGRENEGVE
jgi:TRAP-type C4-dicarboxylate transport system permease small subunit